MSDNTCQLDRSVLEFSAHDRQSLCAEVRIDCVPSWPPKRRVRVAPCIKVVPSRLSAARMRGELLGGLLLDRSGSLGYRFEALRSSRRSPLRASIAKLWGASGSRHRQKCEQVLVDTWRTVEPYRSHCGGPGDWSGQPPLNVPTTRSTPTAASMARRRRGPERRGDDLRHARAAAWGRAPSLGRHLAQPRGTARNASRSSSTIGLTR